MHGAPSAARMMQSAIGSARTASSDRSVAASAALRAPALSPSNSRAGMCSPNSVIVCAPAAASAGPRMVASLPTSRLPTPVMFR